MYRSILFDHSLLTCVPFPPHYARGKLACSKHWVRLVPAGHQAPTKHWLVLDSCRRHHYNRGRVLLLGHKHVRRLHAGSLNSMPLIILRPMVMKRRLVSSWRMSTAAGTMQALVLVPLMSLHLLCTGCGCEIKL
jgi:hypothetical protein